MKKQFKVSIPKPCHEDWSKMTPKEKGKFCQSCSKTVVDFTKKSKEEIQQYLSENFGKRVCGHFRREQLDTITLEIPENTFHQTLSFQKLFLLALLFVMGTSLFSCQNSNGKKQKIENVIVIDSIETVSKQIDSLQTKECTKEDDSQSDSMGKIPVVKRPPFPTPTGIFIVKKETKPLEKRTQTQDSITTIEELEGELDLTVVGDIDESSYEEELGIDSIIEIEEEEEIIEDVPNLDSAEEVEETDVFIGYIIEDVARFPGAKDFSRTDARNDFNQRMKSLFKNYFKAPQVNMDVEKGIYKIHIKIVIDSSGHIAEIDVRRAPHPAFSKEIKRVLQKLPVLIPANQRGKPIRSLYTFPLRVEIE